MKLFAALAMSCLSASCLAGVIVTSDGTRLEGDVRRAEGGWSVIAGGKSTFVAASAVKSIELSGNSGSSTADGLGSLRRSVEASDDLPKIVERYKRFVDQTPDAATAAAARQDLAMWQGRLDRGLVKANRQWVTPEEKKALDAQATQAAIEARLLIKAGQSKEAAQRVDTALQQSPTNISALYLQGVLADAHGDIQAAKKSFDAVRSAAPQHPPTLLNLAVIAMRQKQWGAAQLAMTQALQAAPNTMQLVDAAAELFNSVPEDQRRSQTAIKFAQAFQSQDTQLQKAMAAKKLYRFGSSWIDQPTMDKIAAAEAEAKKKVQQLQGDFDLTQGRIQRIDTEMAANDRSMREMESHSWVMTADGTFVRAPLPSAYYDLQQKNNQLRGEKVEMSNRLNALRDAAKHARDDLPVPKFTGKIAIIGEDGMPVIELPASPTSAPSSRPAVLPTTAPEPPIIRIGPAD